MSVPKVINYCWFGKGKMPKLAEKCLKSWKKRCPDYEIKCWNEENFDISANRYAREAYEAKKWAFVSDYARLKVIYENGGVYLDTDVELLKSLDALTEGKAGYMGFDESNMINTGLGFAAEAGNELVKALLSDYDDIPFKKPDGEYDFTTCPIRSTEKLKETFDLKADNSEQEIKGVRILPREYLCPMDYWSGEKHVTPNTFSVHHYNASWTSPVTRRSQRWRKFLGVKIYNMLYKNLLHHFKWFDW